MDRKFGRDVSMTAMANLALGGLGVLTGILAARLLGPQGRGELAAIQMWPALFGAVGSLGIPNALTYLSSREPRHAGQILTSGLLFLLGWSLPLMVIGFVLLPALLAAQSAQVVEDARIYMLLVPLGYCAGLPLWALQARMEFGVWNALRFCLPFCWVLILVFAGALELRSAGALSRANLVAYGPSIVLIGWAALRSLPGPFRPRHQWLPPLLRYGVPTALSGIPAQLNLRLDQMLMAAFLPAHLLGLYAVAVAWSSAGTPLLHALGVVSFPKLAGLKDCREQALSLRRTIRLSILIVIPLTAAVMAATPVTVPWLFGVEFAPAIPAALVLGVASGFASFIVVLEEGLRGIGRPHWPMVAEFVGLPLTVLLLVVLLPRFQLIGAAVASLVSYAIVTSILVALMIRATRMSLANLLMPRSSDVVLLWLRLRRLVTSANSA